MPRSNRDSTRAIDDLELVRRLLVGRPMQLTKLVVILALGACAADVASTDPADDTAVPDGTTGTTRVRWSENNVQTVTYVVRHGRAMWHGDIDLGPAGDMHERSLAITDLSKRWTDGVINFRFRNVVDSKGNVTTFTPANKQAILDAIDEWALRTPVKFVAAGDTTLAPILQFQPINDDGVSFTDTLGMASPLPGGVTLVHIDSGNTSVAIPLHEIGHALGLDHEQNRADRNDHVDFDIGCTTDASQYDQHPDTEEDLGSYDVSSIMEYPSDNFCFQAPFSPLNNTCICFPLVKKGFSNTEHSCDSTHTTNCTNGFISFPEDLTNEDVRNVTKLYEKRTGVVEAGDRFGAAVVAGDFDGDGIQDLAVGVPGETPGTGVKSGSVVIYRGTSAGLVAWRVIDEVDVNGFAADNDLFGASLAAGDIDGDGADELVIGAPGARGHNSAHRGGIVYVMSGGLGGPGAAVDSSTHAVTFTAQQIDGTTAAAGPQAGSQFGAAVAVGKLHGHMGIAIGAPSYVVGAVAVGRVFWTTPANTTEGVLSAPHQIGGVGFGTALAIADFDDDGQGDLAVGAPGEDRVYYFHSTSASSFEQGPTIVESPAVEGSQFGAALAVGDFDNTGYSATKQMSPRRKELAIGAPGSVLLQGKVLTMRPLITGGTLSWDVLNEVGFGASSANDGFGTSLAVGDLDGDGFDDVVAGAPNKSTGGIAELFHGQAGGLGSSVPVSWVFGQSAAGFETPASGDQTGTAVAVGHFRSSSTSEPDIAEGAPGRHSRSGAMLEFSNLVFAAYHDEATTVAR